MDVEICSYEKRLSEVEDPDVFNKRLKGEEKERKREEKRSQWLEKPLHGSFLKDTEKVSTERTWHWLKGGHLKKETEAIVCAAQEQALLVNSIKKQIVGQDGSPMCTLWGELSETVMHLSRSCPVLTKSKYWILHDIVGKHIYWL